MSAGLKVTGQPSVLYYATSMFQRAGLSMGQEATGIAGILGAFKLACTCACSAPPLSSSCWSDNALKRRHM